LARGCEVAIAQMEDSEVLAVAFAGAEAGFIVPPSDFDPEPGYPSARSVIDAVCAALEVARPARVLCLSTIGADAEEDNLLTQRTMMEQALATLPLPVTFLRAGWFLDNVVWHVASARNEGDPQLPDAARQAFRDGGGEGCRRHRGGADTRALDWSARRGVGGTHACHSQ
jgi:NAD(P)H dehydrogenase (quinone)